MLGITLVSGGHKDKQGIVPVIFDSFIHLVKNCLMNTYYVPGAEGPGIIALNKADMNLIFREFNQFSLSGKEPSGSEPVLSVSLSSYLTLTMK